MAIMITVKRPRGELLDYFPLVMKCFCGVRSGINSKNRSAQETDFYVRWPEPNGSTSGKNPADAISKTVVITVTSLLVRWTLRRTTRNTWIFPSWILVLATRAPGSIQSRNTANPQLSQYFLTPEFTGERVCNPASTTLKWENDQVSGILVLSLIPYIAIYVSLFNRLTLYRLYII